MAAQSGSPSPVRTLRLIKLVHTAVWAFFVATILAIPLSAQAGSYRLSLVCTVVVAVEVGVLGANRLRCPLTDLASRYTTDRRDNFDIYLPIWLARHNKSIFGVIYVIGVLLSIACWRGWLPRWP